MKSRLLLFALALMLLSSTSYAKPHAKPATLSTEQERRVAQIDARVHEIRAMDLSSLSSQERKTLRKEVIQLKKEAGGIASGGVYLSVAAIIIILLVLILIL
ncbi:MAG: hypothetical protein ACKOWL_01190 [Sphingobacteriaceae bacterium]